MGQGTGRVNIPQKIAFSKQTPSNDHPIGALAASAGRFMPYFVHALFCRFAAVARRRISFAQAISASRFSSK